MPDFSSVHDDDFRRSLEADYRELTTALNGGAWKAVHVLAGSIIEAVLADQLAARKYKHPKKDVLELDLYELITASKQENIISQRAASLSDVIRSYRNLIHPGRVLRLREVIDEDSAKIAASLVNVIIRDVAQSARSSYGFSAEEIVEKVRNDPSSVRVLKYLLERTNETEKGRLLLRVLPNVYLQEADKSDFVPEMLLALRECFQLCLSMVGDDTTAKVARDYIRRLEQDNEARIRLYDVAFFKPSYLQHLDGRDREMAKQHLFPLVEDIPSDRMNPCLGGLAQYVAVEEVYDFGNPIITRYFRDSEGDPFAPDACLPNSATLTFVQSEYFWLASGCQTKFDEMLTQWENIVSNSPCKPSLLKALKQRLVIDDDLPF